MNDTISELPYYPVELPKSEATLESVFNYFQASEHLVDPDARREYFSQMDGEAMLHHVQNIRSLVETGEADQYHEFDGEGVSTGSLQPPHPEDKPKLFMYAWDGVANSILSNDNYSTEQALKYAGLVAGGAIVLTHLFGDGNGRTSRIVAGEVMHGSGVSRDDLKNYIVGSEKALYIRPPQDFSLKRMPFKLNDSDGSIRAGMLEYVSEEELRVALAYQRKTGNEDLVLVSDEKVEGDEAVERECYRRFLAAGFMAWVDVATANPAMSPNNELTADFFERRIARSSSCIGGGNSDLIKSREERISRDRKNLQFMRENYGTNDEWRIPYLEQYALRSRVLSGKLIEE